jgi:hypothetical protein
MFCLPCLSWSERPAGVDPEVSSKKANAFETARNDRLDEIQKLSTGCG